MKISEAEFSRDSNFNESDVHKDRLLNRAVLICIVITVLISGISLTGWVSGWLIITRISENFIPMAPSTSLSFIFLSLALYIHIRYPEGHRIRVFTAGGVFIILLICSVISLNNLTDINLDVERFLLSSHQKFGNVSIGRMSPVTAGNFLLSGFSLLLLLTQHGGGGLWRAKGIAVILAVTAALVGLWVSLSYLYGTFVLYETTIIPVALNTSVAFMVLSLGIIASAGASCWPVSSLIGSSVKVRLLRSFLPVTIAIILIYGWFNSIILTRFLDPALIAALTTILSIFIISFVVSRIAKVIGGAIDLADAERRRAEEERRANEERYRSLFENMLNGFAYCRMLFEGGRPLDFIYLDVNFAFERLTGLKNVVGKKVTEVIPGIREADPGLFEIYGRVALTGKPEKFEIYVAALNSWFSIAVYSPEREYFVAVFDVITERRRTEEALQKSEERYRRITGAISDYIYKVRVEDGNPVETTHSEACFAVTGYTSQEFAAEPYLWFRMVMEEDHNLVREQAAEILSGRHPRPIEHRIIRKDGKIRWVESTVVPNYDINGTLISYDGILCDITEHKNLENQLLHAQKMEAIGQLAGCIAHDFNNILSAIVNYAYIIKNGMDEDDPLRDQVEQISSLTVKASEITRDLLSFSRKHIINLIPVNLNNSAKNMEKLLSKFIGEDVQIKLKLSEKDLIIMADSAQIEQIIINLATNARDAMPDGGSITIETDLVTIDDNFIKMHGFGKPGIYSLLSFTDTGTGMDEETKKKIFEPFFTTKEIGKGTGLGLAIIYGIVKQHDGYINVYSETGEGTTFKIYLRTVKAAVQEEKEINQSDLTGNAEIVLVAEDKMEVRTSIRVILEKFGYKVIEAADGEDAIEKFRENKDKINILLLDVIMPKKNGKEAYEEIKKITPGIKVIFTSGYTADIIDKKRIITDGFTHILKPLSPDKLLSAIKETLQNGK